MKNSQFIMKRQAYLLIIIWGLPFTSSFAHQDFWVVKDYANVKVRVKTGYNYEEINKAFIIGQLAEKLAKELNYSDQIFLDFNHQYVEDCTPAYFISFDKGKIEYTRDRASEEKDYLSQNTVVVRQVSRQFNAIATLKLLEYSIQDISSVKALQKQIEYDQNFCQWRINTIDTILIATQLNKPTSDLINKLLKTRIERPVEDDKPGISYYVQDNLYKLYTKGLDNKTREIFTLRYIYDILETEAGTLVFDSDTSFYLIEFNLLESSEISTKHIIDNKQNFYKYRPYTEETMLYYYLKGKIKKE